MAAKADPTTGCYVDLFDCPQHTGKLRRLYGPAIYSSLRRSRESAGDAARAKGLVQRRGTPIESIIVGPAAYVLCFNSRDPSRRSAWLVPNQIVRSWTSSRLSPAIDSFKIFDREPIPADTGYDAYRHRQGKSS
jgi:hypothetical protein